MVVGVAQGIERPRVAIGAPSVVIPKVAPPGVASQIAELEDLFLVQAGCRPSSYLWLEPSTTAGVRVRTDRHKHRFAVLLTDRRDAFFGLGAGDLNLQEFFGQDEDSLWLAEEVSSALMTSQPLELQRGTLDKLLTLPAEHPRYVQARRMLEELGISFLT